MSCNLEIAGYAITEETPLPTGDWYLVSYFLPAYAKLRRADNE